MERINFRSVLMASILVFMSACALFPSRVQAASGPRLNKTKVVVYVGKKTALKIKGASGKVVWSTKDKKIAAVSRSGKVTGKKAGKTIIKAKVDKKSVKCAVTVKEPYLNAKKKTLDLNERFQLKLTGAGIERCTSGDKKIATVTKKGKVTAVKAGKAKISVKASNGKVYRCSITVKRGNTPSKRPSGDGSEEEKPSGDKPEGGTPPGDDAEEERPPGDDAEEEKPSEDESQRKDLAGLDLDVYMTEQFIYTGRAIEPSIRVYDDNIYLEEGVDYKVSYTDNVNAGNAKVTISGIGGFTGEVIRGFEILKADQYIEVGLPDKVYVGKTGKIVVSGAYGDLGFEASQEGIAQIDSDGTITGLKPGSIDINITVGGDENHHGCEARCYGSVRIWYEEATAYGFCGRASSADGRRYKSATAGCVDTDGSISFIARFDCNADIDWLDAVTFEAEDATPAAYKKMFQDMGVDRRTPTVTVQSIPDAFIYNSNVSGSVAADYTGSDDELACSSKQIQIKAGAGVRVVRLTAKRNGVFLDEMYLGSGDRRNGGYSAFDLDLYKRVRERVEAQIWTEQMSGLEKLQALANYISRTTHYPTTDVTKKEYNPTFWADWSVDGIGLFYDMYQDVILNRVMCLQGGIVTCYAAQILQRAAEEDLGLPYLYTYDPDTDTETIADGEGVWVATGSHSSNPWNPGHMSLIYKDVDESKVFIDAQGLILYGDQASCETHGCRENIVSLDMPILYE